MRLGGLVGVLLLKSLFFIFLMLEGVSSLLPSDWSESLSLNLIAPIGLSSEPTDKKKIKLAVFQVIYQTQGRVKKVEKTTRCQANQLQSVWISNETLFRVFDIASQAIIIVSEIQSKSSKNFMIIRITYPNVGK